MHTQNIIIPSVLEYTYFDTIKYIKEYSAISNRIQIDICDGIYTIKKTWLPNSFEDIKGFDIDLEFDMMVIDIKEYLPLLYYYDARKIIIHIHNHTDEEYRAIYDEIKTKNKLIQVGVAISSNDDIRRIVDNLDCIDYIQVMTIDKIGAQGEMLSVSQLEKVKLLANFFNMNDIKRAIQVDGAIDDITLLKAKEAGATSFAIGHFLKDSKDKKLTFNSLKNL